MGSKSQLALTASRHEPKDHEILQGLSWLMPPIQTADFCQSFVVCGIHQHAMQHVTTEIEGGSQ